VPSSCTTAAMSPRRVARAGNRDRHVAKVDTGGEVKVAVRRLCPSTAGAERAETLADPFHRGVDPVSGFRPPWIGQDAPVLPRGTWPETPAGPSPHRRCGRPREGAPGRPGSGLGRQPARLQYGWDAGAGVWVTSGPRKVRAGVACRSRRLVREGERCRPTAVPLVTGRRLDVDRVSQPGGRQACRWRRSSGPLRRRRPPWTARYRPAQCRTRWNRASSTRRWAAAARSRLSVR